LLQKEYKPSNSIGIAYVTDRQNFKTVMNIGGHNCFKEDGNSKPLILLDGQGGLMTINGKNCINRIRDLYSTRKNNADEIRILLNDSGFTELNLGCLEIVKISLRYKLNYKIKRLYRKLMG
jgi:hypothetical protein